MKSLHLQTLTDLKQIDRDCRSELEKAAYPADVATYWGIDMSSTSLSVVDDLYHVFLGGDEQDVPATSTSYALQAACIGHFMSELKQFLNNHNVTRDMDAINDAIDKYDQEGGMLCEITNYESAHPLTDDAFGDYFEALDITDPQLQELSKKLFHSVAMVCYLNLREIRATKFGEMMWFIATHHVEIKQLKLII